jgi:hypothetical protein
MVNVHKLVGFTINPPLIKARIIPKTINIPPVYPVSRLKNINEIIPSAIAKTDAAAEISFQKYGDVSVVKIMF